MLEGSLVVTACRAEGHTPWLRGLFPMHHRFTLAPACALCCLSDVTSRNISVLVFMY